MKEFLVNEMGEIYTYICSFLHLMNPAFHLTWPPQRAPDPASEPHIASRPCMEVGGGGGGRGGRRRGGATAVDAHMGDWKMKKKQFHLRESRACS